MTILGSLSTMGNVKPTSMTRSSFGGSSFGGSSQSANNVACGGCGGNGINIDANVNVNLGGLLGGVGGLLGGVLGTVGGLLGGGGCHTCP
ncbi:hssA/2C/7E family protein [Heterostelium album PN500]|uniref:HssA/2C/7E family protein n=1 Tax=Heterostelium pallidum (strain ATCC 26659 / Pp 5 / PN500) TaxID=670386 RepID=D3BEF8_HETP5|nr:hssA/2C/7E family protein [Heterostelium album PN500]EFA80289.1 hssA/2C/7E family protein [Heterostelium album PN500]|eukprot:XP_020432409.1 hssA/2C/7E family protein [Heterostelium album PN500]